jgi:WD40 repeat protein
MRQAKGSCGRSICVLLGALAVAAPGAKPASAADRGPELVVQTGHSAGIRKVSMDEAGKYLLTVSDDDGKAILWDVGSGQQLRTYAGAGGRVETAALSADGKRVLTGNIDNTAILWDARSGEQLRIFNGHSAPIEAVAFSADGERVLTGSANGMAILWEASSAKKMQKFEVPTGGVDSAPWVHTVALSGDGKRALTSSHIDNTTIVWDVSSGKRIRTLKSGAAAALSADGKRVLTAGEAAILWDAESGEKLRAFESAMSVAFSSDGKRILTGSAEGKVGTTIMWDTASGRQLRAFKGHKHGVSSVTFSADGNRAVTGSPDKTAILWDTTSGRPLQTFEGHADPIWSLAVSANGNRILTGSNAVNSAILWDAVSGEQLRSFRGDGKEGASEAPSTDGKHDDLLELLHRDYAGAPVALSADGTRVLTVSSDSRAILWDTADRKQLQIFKVHGDRLTAVALSVDGKRALTGSWDGTVILWDSIKGDQLRSFKGHSGPVDSVALSVDGKRVLTGSCDKTAILWDAASGKRLQTFEGHTDLVKFVALSEDGKRALTGSYDKSAILWDAANGKQLRTFKGHHDEVFYSGYAAALSSDGTRALTGSADTTAILWDAVTGKQLRTYKGHTGHVGSVAMINDGKRALTVSQDGTTRLWDAETGDELCRLISLDGGQDWLVVTPSGLFDGSAGGRQKVMYRIGNGLNVVPVDRFFQDFYRPGLLASVVKGEKIKAPDFATSRPPTVRITAPRESGTVEKREVMLATEVADEGGGIQGPALFLNGARLLAEAETSKDGKIVKRSFKVSLVEGDNHFEVKAASADGSWESEPALLTLRYEKPLGKPVVHFVAVGISKYAEDSYRLKFAREDAAAMAKLFRERGSALYREVKTTTLLDAEATRDRIRETLQKVPKDAQPQDTLVLFLAGHGAMVGQRYYFIPHDFRIVKDRKLEDDIRQQGLPADELADFLSSGPALKRILILDTCASGGAVDLFRVAARNPFAFRGEIERLSRSQGVCILAASAATEEAKEPRDLGHGVLTYTLLAGMKAVDGGPLERKWLEPSGKEQVVDVLEWFSYAEGHVRRLTKEYCGQEQNVHMGLRGSSFPVLPLK